MYTVKYKSIYRNGGCFFYAQNKVVTEMPDVVKNPVSDVFERWKATIEPVVGKGSFSNDESQTVASNKRVYARLFLLGNPTSRGNLEGDECATTPSFQSESYATGSKASSKVYEIDDASHKAMVGMGFRRIYGPVRQNNADNSIKRVVSRYSRIYTGTLL